MKRLVTSLIGIILTTPLASHAFLGMNAGATLQGPLPAWTKQLGEKGTQKQTTVGGVAVDSSGYAYVVGSANGNYDGQTLTGFSDYVLSKFDSSGTKIWTLQKGIASKNISGNAVAVDSSGNVIIAGDTTAGLDGNSQTGSTDFVVIKYDSTGARIWTQQLGVASSATYSHAVATDSSGNVFIAGSTGGGLDGNTLSGTSNSDAFVTKYSAAGTKLWTKQIGVSGAYTYGLGVASDSSGNVYLSGYTSGGLDGNTPSQSNDLFITKYNSSGTKQWTRQLGTASVSATYGYAISADTSGNIYVTGYTEDGLDGNTQAGTDDAFLVKYDSSGNRQWTRQLGVASDYTHGYAVTTDATGNVFLTGYSDGALDGNSVTGTQDFFVTKYDSSGAKQWTRQLGVTAKATQGKGIATDSSGNAFLAGLTYGDLDGNTLSGTKDLFLTKYSTTGSRSWTRQLGAYTGSSAGTTGFAVATDSSGNVYAAGKVLGDLDGNTQMGQMDFYVTKYNSTGARLWTKQLGVASKVTEANGVAVDSSGNVFVAGYTTGGLDGNALVGGNDLFVTKYDPSGNKLWTKQLGVASSNTHAQGVATDSSGNVFLTGYTTGNLDGVSKTGAQDIFVVKYNATGTKQWTKLLGASGAYSTGNGAAMDTSGNIFVTGATGGSLPGNTLMGSQDLVVAKYDTSGTRLWVKQLGVSTQYVSSYGVATDPSGNVFMTGSTAGGLDGNTQIGSSDAFVVKYDPSGNKLWTRQFGAASAYIQGKGIAVDSFGNSYVVGETDHGLDGNTLTGTQDFFVTKYTSAGVKQWTKQLGTASNMVTVGGIAMSSNGQLSVAGTTYGGLDYNTLSGSTDLYICKYIGN